jgi:enoyl-[acyl-carrier protein] reductase I
MNSNLLKGKKGIIFGIANERSIAYSIAKNCYENGAELVLTYLNDAFKKRVEPIAESFCCKNIFECDVSNECDITKLFNEVSKIWDKVDFVVHAVAFSDKNELTGRYIETSLNNFLNSMNISCFSLTGVARIFEPLLKKSSSGSILTLSYYGAEKVMPHYNVMGVCKAALEASVKYLAMDMGINGIRVNSISAGPIRTLASSGIGDFNYILQWNQFNSPLRRNVTQDEVGKAALFLLSDHGSGVTGENLHVDCGYHVVGMKAVDAPDISKVKD